MVDFMKKKMFLITVVILIFSLFSYRLYTLRIKNHDYYLNLYEEKTTKYLYGLPNYRGRILDSNGKILVDNKKVNIITYRLINNPSTDYLINLAYKLINILNLTEEASKDELKKYYLLTENTNYLLTSKDKDNLKYRKVTDTQIEKIKYERIDKELEKYTLKDRIAIHTFYLLTDGYYYDTKVITKRVSDNLCLQITEYNLTGLTCEYIYERDNLYNIIPSIIGRVGSIKKEDKDTYLEKGYLSTDLVGLSGLELFYENMLHGKRDKYIIKSDNTLELVEQGSFGEDLSLNIDLDLELKLLEIQKNNMIKVKKLKNTQYFDTNYTILSNPKTGEILALSGLKYQNNTFFDVSSNIILTSYTVGSVIKGASNTVGYLNNAIDINKSYKDSCIKIYKVPKKCSYKELGYLNDITALKHSSNYYQFMTAIKVLGKKYSYNMDLEVTLDDFNKYRRVFSTFGLGSSTGIDFSKENTGIKGNKIASDLYLNLAIGQYDTYTPLQILNYINTIANNGTRMALSFKKGDPKELNKVSLEPKYLKRIQEGFYEVVNGGTANNFINKKYHAAGKTGTAQNYYAPGITTINTTFASYFPFADPKYSLVVLNPNISVEGAKVKYNAPLHRLISTEITNYLFAKP